MSVNKILIYEEVADDVAMIEYLCKQHEMEPHLARDFSEAEHILKREDISVAVINYALEKLTLKSDIAVVATGESRLEASMKIIGYNPVCFIPKPLTFATISLGLTKAAKSLCETKSYPSNVVNVFMILGEMEAKLIALTKDEHHNMTLSELVKDHCEEHCPFACTGSQMSQDDENEYEVLNYFTSRGALFCKRKNICELWRFHDWLAEDYPHLVSERPTDLLRCDSLSEEKIGFMDGLTRVIQKYNDKINLLYELKFEYDMKKCDAKKEGLEFQKGDHLFSKADEIMNCTNCAYCTEHECPLDKFFEIFKRKVI